MARINTNVASLTAQRGLAKSQKTMSDTLRRLSSGLRINRGADDPAGLIASETLRSEISGVHQAIDNSSRASNVIACARAPKRRRLSDSGSVDAATVASGSMDRNSGNIETSSLAAGPRMNAACS